MQRLADKKIIDKLIIILIIINDALLSGAAWFTLEAMVNLTGLTTQKESGSFHKINKT